MKLAAYFSFAMVILCFSVMSRVLFFRNIYFDRVFSLILVGGVALSALFLSVGTDYLGYKEHYYNIASSGLLNISDANGGWWETGFSYLAGIFGMVGFGYDIFLLACVFVSLFVCYLAAKDFTKNILFFFFSLFCLGFMFLPFIRQDLAASLVFLSFVSFVKGRYFSYIILVFSAVLVHKSSIIPAVLIMFSMPNFFDFIFRFVKKNFVVLFFMFLFVVFLIEQLDLQRIALQLSVYGSDDFVQGVLDERTSLIRNYLKFGFYFGLVAMVYWALPASMKKIEGGDEIMAWCFRYVFIFSLACLFFMSVSAIFSRLSIYVFPFVSLVCARGLDSVRISKPFSLVVYSFVSGLFFLHMYIALYPMLEWM